MTTCCIWAVRVKRLGGEKRIWLLMALIVGVSTMWAQADELQAKPDPEAVERARDQVKMLDDIYKTTVVLITTHYVNDEDDLAAGSAAKALFAAIEKKGWHKVRLLDVSGEPYNDENVAKDAFDKDAVGKLKSGKGFVERIEVKDGKPVFRAMTAVPVVMEKCIMCHENYRSVPKGAAVGAISYTIPIR